LAPRDLDQLSIFGVAVTSNVNSEQAQVANKLSQVSIGNKLSSVAHLQPILRERSNSPEFEWEDVDRRFSVDNVAKIHRLTFSQDQIDLGVGDATGFYDVLDRGSLRQLPLNCGGFRAQEK